MSLYATLWHAVAYKQSLRLLAPGGVRDLCPYALGFKVGRLRLVGFQVGGKSVSGLMPGGAWRAFFLDDIAWAVPIDIDWRIGSGAMSKIETCLDQVQCRADG